MPDSDAPPALPLDMVVTGPRVQLVGFDGEMIDLPFSTPLGETRVYHYTNASGLLGIIDSSTVWASSPLGLNDTSELAYGRSVVAAAWSEWDKSGLRPTLCEAVDQFFRDDEMSARLLESIYILSASFDGDSLNQWQGYSGRQGYCVALNTKTPLATVLPKEVVNPPGFVSSWFGIGGWFSVIYDPEEQLEAARNVLSTLVSVAPDNDEDLVNNFRYEVGHLISPLIVQIKHPAFLDEREVRFIAARAFNVPEESRTGAYGIIPYVSLGAGPHSAPSFIDGRDKSQLPIEGVVCGPTNESERPYVEQSARRLLSTRGYEVPVTTSKVPYRF